MLDDSSLRARHNPRQSTTTYPNLVAAQFPGVTKQAYQVRHALRLQTQTLHTHIATLPNTQPHSLGQLHGYDMLSAYMNNRITPQSEGGRTSANVYTCKPEGIGFRVQGLGCECVHLQTGGIKLHHALPDEIDDPPIPSELPPTCIILPGVL